jgi:hypothetical protein
MALIANLATMIYSVVVNRQLYNDGAHWALRLLASGEVIRDSAYDRYFPLIWQLPSRWALHAGLEDPTTLAVNLFCAFTGLHPLLSLACCYWILRRHSRSSFMLFPLLSFAVATQLTIPFAMGVVPDALTVFWPLFLLTLFSDGQALAESLGIFLLSCALACTYETACLFFCGLLVLVVIRQRSLKRWSSADFFHAVLFLSGAAWLLWRSLGPAAGYQGNFIYSLSRITGEMAIGFVVLAIIQWALYFWKKISESALLFSLLGIAVAALLDFIFHTGGSTLALAYHARTLAVPFAAIIAVFCFIAFLKGWKGSYGQPGAGAASISYSLAIVLLFAAAFDFHATQAWMRGVADIKRLLSEGKACVFLLPGSPSHPYAREVSEANSPTELSLVLQKTKRPQAVVISVQLQMAGSAADVCEEFARGHVNLGYGSTDVSRYFDMSLLRGNMAGQFRIPEFLQAGGPSRYFEGVLEMGTAPIHSFPIFGEARQSTADGWIWIETFMVVSAKTAFSYQFLATAQPQGKWSTRFLDNYGNKKEAPVELKIENDKIATIHYAKSMSEFDVETTTIEIGLSSESRSTTRHSSEEQHQFDVVGNTHLISKDDFLKKFSSTNVFPGAELVR